MAAARAADATPRKGRLDGLPMAVKDLSPVKGIRSTSGSPIFADLIPTADGTLARNLRAAGAIFIGKTNTPEFGLGSPVSTRSTASPAILTTTPAPRAVLRGGAAAALAARLLPIADGSDMMGSLRDPAAFCNVFGFRPSYALVPSDAVGDTFLHQLSTNGPMARDVEDIARLLEVLARPDPRLPHSRAPQPDAEALDVDPKGMRIGWLGDWGGAYPMEPGILGLCRSALGTFEDMGCIVEVVEPPFSAAAIWESWTTLRSFAIAGSTAALHADPGTERF